MVTQPAVPQTAEPRPGRRAAVAYVGALLISVAAVVLTVVLQPYLPRLTLLFALTAVVVSAWRGGLGPGLVAAGVGVVGVWYYILPPVRAFGGVSTQDLVWIGAYLAVSTLICALAEALHRALAATRRQAAVLRDRTDALAVALGEVERANRTKAEFLANMSHELRTPLNAIQGHVQLIELGLHGPVTPGQLTALGRVQRAQRHLLGLITDILNFAKLESGRVEFDVREVDVRDVVTDMLPMIEPLAEAKGLALAVHVPGLVPGLMPGATAPVPDEPATDLLVWADRDKLAQVLLNLLSNAVKFSVPGGTVTVAVERADPPDDAVRIHVRDTGIGIPAHRLDDVFEPFVQLRGTERGRATAQGSEGTGLGLAISRDLARGMGGELAAHSVEGEGSTFTVSLRPSRTTAGTPAERRVRRERREASDRRRRPDRRGAVEASATLSAAIGHHPDTDR